MRGTRVITRYRGPRRSPGERQSGSHRTGRLNGPLIRHALTRERIAGVGQSRASGQRNSPSLFVARGRRNALRRLKVPIRFSNNIYTALTGDRAVGLAAAGLAAAARTAAGHLGVRIAPACSIIRSAAAKSLPGEMMRMQKLGPTQMRSQVIALYWAGGSKLQLVCTGAMLAHEAWILSDAAVWQQTDAPIPMNANQGIKECGSGSAAGAAAASAQCRHVASSMPHQPHIPR